MGKGPVLKTGGRKSRVGSSPTSSAMVKFLLSGKEIGEWLLKSGPKILLILIFALFFQSLSKRVLQKVIAKRLKIKLLTEEKKRVIETIIVALGGTLRFLIWILAILMILPEFGINPLPILSALGIMGLAVSMAVRDIISDFISGIFILLEGQYYVGDEIKVNEIEGKVKEFTLRKTVIQDKEGNLYFIPNNQIKIVIKKSQK